MLEMPRIRSRMNWLRGLQALCVVCAVGFAPSRIAQACADCKWQGETWWCFDNSAINPGYRYCQTWDAQNLCLLSGDCPARGGGGVRGVATLAVIEVWDATGAANSAIASKGASASTVSGVRSAVALAAGLAGSSVHLRGSGFVYALGDLMGSKGEAVAIGDSGFLLHSATSGNGIALTACGYRSEDKTLYTLGSFIVKPGDVTLVSLPSMKDSIVISIRMDSRMQDEVAPLLESIQKLYKGEVAEILEATSLNIAPSEAPADCGF